MTRWFTSDTHFGHTNIIKYCNRPFADAGEMDRSIIESWNKLVAKDDEVYHMGDFAFATPDRIKHILENLNGSKRLIVGNHDRQANRMFEYGFSYVTPNLRGLELKDHTLANLSHYPYRGTDDPHHKTKFDNKNLEDDGRLLICGHVHTAWKTIPGKFKNHMINVGMDQWDYKPVSEDQLIAYHNSLLTTKGK